MKPVDRFFSLSKNSQRKNISSIFNNDNHAVLGVVSLIAYTLFAVSVSKYNITAVLAFAAFPLFIIVALQLPVRIILERLLFLSPFILIMALPNFFYDHRPFMTVGRLTLSAGFVSGLVIICKSFTTITVIIVCFFCLSFYRFCMVLRILRVPDVFVTQLQLLYRYSFLLAEEAQSLQRARNMRAFGGRGKDLFTTAKLIGSLLLRTSDRAGRIYRAMVARGFEGTIGVRPHFSFKYTDLLIIIGIIMLFAAIRIIF